MGQIFKHTFKKKYNFNKPKPYNNSFVPYFPGLESNTEPSQNSKELSRLKEENEELREEIEMLKREIEELNKMVNN